MAHRRSLRAAALALAGGLAAAALTGQSGAVAQPESPSGTTTRSTAAAGPVLRVYNNNIENLITNLGNDRCDRVYTPEHAASMLVDDNGQTGTAGVAAPDLLIFQQVRGKGQIQAYADQLSTYLGLPVGTYQSVVVWDAPEAWGGTHKCKLDPALGDLKKEQTNGIIYNTQTLSLAETSNYWSAAWPSPTAGYQGGAGCVLYKPPNNDQDAGNYYKYKRTSAIAAKFIYKATGTTVGAATMHLPEGTGSAPCGGVGNKGIGDTGISFGGTASSLLLSSQIRVIGMDANNGSVPADVLASSYGVLGRGTGPTYSSTGGAPTGGQIDYLFTNGTVLPSPIGNTVNSTLSNHKAVYSFITW